MAIVVDTSKTPSGRRFLKRRNGKRKPKKKAVYNTKMTLHRSPMPVKFITTMIYSQSHNLNAGIATVGTQIYRANGLYDPDVSGTGHQPRGFDEIMPLYDHFIVLSSKIKVRFVGTGNVPFAAGVALRDTVTIPATTNNYQEGSLCKWTTLSESDDNRSVTLGSNISKFLSLKYNDDALRGTASTSPIEQAYWHVWAGALDGASDPATVTFNSVIEYKCMFIEPKVPTQS